VFICLSHCFARCRKAVITGCFAHVTYYTALDRKQLPNPKCGGGGNEWSDKVWVEAVRSIGTHIEREIVIGLSWILKCISISLSSPYRLGFAFFTFSCSFLIPCSCTNKLFKKITALYDIYEILIYIYQKIYQLRNHYAWNYYVLTVGLSAFQQLNPLVKVPD
jgi:hypothetical protein